MTIRLFQFETSMFCEKVRIVLHLKELPYETIDASKDERKSLIEFSGQKKVPAMDYHGRCVIDSTVISAFLETEHPENSIYPAGVFEKGLCLVMEDWADEVLFDAVHKMRPPEPPEVRAKGEAELEIHLQTLDQLFAKRGFIFDRMSLADIAIFTELHYLYTRVKFEIPSRHQNVMAWMDRMRQTLRLGSLSDVAA
jgi:glutathione S-transferase